MAPASEKVLQLRALLSERFGSSDLPSEIAYITGLPVLDEVGLSQGAVTEIVSSPDAPGGSLLLYGLLHAVAQWGERTALIDGASAFQPKNLPQSDLQRLLWSQCRNAKEALGAVDLAVRDGNFPLVVLLLTLNSPSELRRLPGTAWHRLQMLAEKSATALLVFTPFPQVGCARLRLAARGDFPLAKLHVCRSELFSALRLDVERRRMGQEGRCRDEVLRRPLCA
jgi:hypothetical protein